MRFPLRLTANLAVGRVSRACSFNSKDSSAIFDLCSDETVPPGCRVVWIGGPDPLARAEVARLVNSSAASGRYVFLSINGARLRRRIHEFQPSSRLYLTIRFDVGRCVSDRVARVDLLAVALDAVRAANLSGFHA